MVTFIRKSTKQSLLTMLRKADKITPRLLARLFEGVLFKDEYETFSAAGGLDHGDMGGLADDDHVRYVDIDGTRALTGDWDAGAFEIRAETLESDVGTGTAPLTIASETMVDNLNADLLDGYDEADFDYTLISGNDADTDVTGAELEELTDLSTTILHGHELTGGSGMVCLSEYIDIKARNAEYHIHGHLHALDTAHDLGAGDLVVTCGLSKIMIIVNAGTDVVGDITVTGTIVNRNTGAEYAAVTDTITIDAVTTDGSDTDASSNVRHAFTGAYITENWFKGSITISSADTDVTDMDTYQVAFEQFNDSSSITLDSFDISAHASNTAAWMYAYLYTLEVTGDKCDITRIASLELPAADVSANLHYRLRKGLLDVDIDGTTDGIWIDMIPGPLASAYWHDINIKVWATIGAGETTTTGYGITGTITGSPGIEDVTVTLTGDASDSTSTDSNGDYSLIELEDGNYTVTPTKTGYTFVPASIAVVISGADETGNDFSGYTGTWPQDINWEGLSVADPGDGNAVSSFGSILDVRTPTDYGTIDRTIVGPSFTNIMRATHGASAAAGATYLLGEGFTPEDNELLRIEMLCFTSGIAAHNAFRIHDAASQEMLLFQYENKTFTIRSYTGGAGTTVATAELTADSAFPDWFRLMFEWDFGDHSYRARCVLTSSGGTTDYGWKTGTASIPTYDDHIEMDSLTFYTQATSADQDNGFAQVWISKSSAIAFPDGSKETRTIDP